MEVNNEKKFKLNKINPDILNACILEIIESADEILELYQIDGTLLNISVGSSENNTTKGDNYSIQPNYSSESTEDKAPFGLQISYDKIFPNKQAS